MQGTAAVARKRDPLRTNEEAFYEVLAPRLPVSREAFDAPVAEFYRTVFPACARDAASPLRARHGRMADRGGLSGRRRDQPSSACGDRAAPRVGETCRWT